jgi:hypothetical protein
MIRIREVEYADREAVGQLMRAEGWRAPTDCDWRWLWEQNPAMRNASAARGWVLLDQDAVVGFLGNLVQAYQLESRRLLAATATALVVAPAFRANSLQLMLAHAKQTGVDLVLNTTSAPNVSRISGFLKFRSIPQPDYDRTLFWILRARPFARSALRKKGFASAAAGAAAPLAAAVIGAERVLRRRGAPGRGARGDVFTIAPKAIGPEFDALWERRVSGRRCLLAVRDAETMRWHFADRGGPHPPFLVCARNEARLVGYAAVVRQDAPLLGLRRARVADLFVEQDDPDTIARLWRAASQEARAAGASMIEVVGFPRRVRNVLHALRPFELVDRSSPFLYKTDVPDLQEQLTHEDVWYASLFDGDGSI